MYCCFSCVLSDKLHSLPPSAAAPRSSESGNRPTSLFTVFPFTINNGLIKEMLSDQPERGGQ